MGNVRYPRLLLPLSWTLPLNPPLQSKLLLQTPFWQLRLADEKEFSVDLLDDAVWCETAEDPSTLPCSLVPNSFLPDEATDQFVGTVELLEDAVWCETARTVM